jgi:hypothetical protein
MKKLSLKLSMVALAVVAILMCSCSATMHTVGTGGKGDCKSTGQYDAHKKQWYLFWGLLPLNHIDSKDMTGGSQNYTIRTTTTFVDGLIAVPGSYLLGLKSQTIRVSKGDK